MARPLRIQYPGAIYHVLSRGDRREQFSEPRLIENYFWRLVWYDGVGNPSGDEIEAIRI